MVQEWRIRVSIPVPPACEAGALPFVLNARYYKPFIRHTNNLLTKTGKIGQLQIVFNARHIQDGANQQTLQPSVPNLELSAFSTSLVLAQAIIASQSFIRCQLLIGDSTNAVKAPGKTHLPFVLIN